MSSLLDVAADLLRDQLFTSLERVEGPALVLTSDTGTVVLLDLAPVPVLRCSVLVDPGPAARVPDLLMAAMLEVADVPLARLSYRTEPVDGEVEDGDHADVSSVVGGRRLVGEVTADLFVGNGISTGALLAGIQAAQQGAALAAEVLASAAGTVPSPHEPTHEPTHEPAAGPAGPADVPGLAVDPAPDQPST